MRVQLKALLSSRRLAADCASSTTVDSYSPLVESTADWGWSGRGEGPVATTPVNIPAGVGDGLLALKVSFGIYL